LAGNRRLAKKRNRNLVVMLDDEEHARSLAVAIHHDLTVSQVVRRLMADAYAEMPVSAKKPIYESRQPRHPRAATGTPAAPESGSSGGLDVLGTILCSKCMIDPGPEVISLEELFDPAEIAAAKHACSKCGSKEALLSVPTPPPSADGTVAA
jgi:hypothetical protein